jgi:hypothetical protein
MLFCAGHFGKRAAIALRRDEDGVVAETGFAAGRRGDGTEDGSSRRMFPAIDAYRDGDRFESSGAIGAVTERREQLRHIVRIARPRTRVPRRVDTWRATERIDGETGVVGDGVEFNTSATARALIRAFSSSVAPVSSTSGKLDTVGRLCTTAPMSLVGATTNANVVLPTARAYAASGMPARLVKISTISRALSALAVATTNGNCIVSAAAPPVGSRPSPAGPE